MYFLHVLIVVDVLITFFLTNSVFIVCCVFFFSNVDIFFDIPDDVNILEDPGASNPVVSVSMIK